MKKNLRIFLGVLAVSILLYSSYQLVKYFHEAGGSDRAAAELQNLAVTDRADPSAPKTEDGVPKETMKQEQPLSDPAPIQVDFDALQQECPDIVGWLYCPDTPINYPVVQGTDNAQYLHSLPDGQYSVSGTLFLDFQNTRDFSDLHSVIYGHHMKNYSMLGSIPRYQEEKYRQEHKSLWLLTPRGDWQCDAAAGAVIPAESGLYDFPQRFEELQAVFKDFAFPDAEMPGEDRQYLTLSTCTYEFENARYVLICTMNPCENQ